MKGAKSSFEQVSSMDIIISNKIAESHLLCQPELKLLIASRLTYFGDGPKSFTTGQWIQHLKLVGKDMQYPCRIWQEKFHDRVLRMDELEQTRLYIRDNPKKLYPGNNLDVG